MFYFQKSKKMKLQELSLLRDKELSEKQIEKLQMVLAFYNALPTDTLKVELLTLMEQQPSMAPHEFDSRLSQFSVQVKSAMAPTQPSLLSTFKPSMRSH